MKRLQDIADQVGVSRTTVSNVLHGNTKKVSKEMIRKISEILNQEGYVPNTSSRELTRKGSCIIGLVLGYNCVHGIPSLRDTFVAELLSGVEVNRSPSSRQLKKYKFFLPVEIYLLAVLCSLQVNFVFFHWC